MRIAIIEGEPNRAEALAGIFSGIGGDSHTFDSGGEAVKGLHKESYDLIVLDWQLPDMGGDAMMEWIRENLDWQVPVMVISKGGHGRELVKALNLGADDYLALPVQADELVARVRALLRRALGAVPGRKVLVFGQHVIDLERREIRVDGVKVTLTQKEFDLASFLFRNNGRLLSRAHLMETVWGHGEKMNTRTLDTHISRLRKKLQLNADHGWRLCSVYHHGYRLEAVGSPEEVPGLKSDSDQQEPAEPV